MVRLSLTRTGRRLLRKRRTLNVRAVVSRRGGPNLRRSSESVTFRLRRRWARA
jgi:hypothetical protein